MGILVPNILFILLILRHFAIGFLLISRSFLPARRPALPLFALTAGLLDPFLLHGQEVKDLPIRCGQGLGDAPISTESPLSKLLGRQMPQVLGDLLRSRIDGLFGHRHRRILCSKGEPPVAAFHGKMNRGGHGMESVRGIGNLADWAGLGAH